MRCALIEAEKASYPIAWMCDQLGVARSSFYAWRAAADTVTATAARRQPEVWCESSKIFLIRSASSRRRVWVGVSVRPRHS